MASRPRRTSGQQQQPKQDHQSRAKWTTPLTKILADLMVVQVLKGNKQNNSFGKKAWKCICDEFHKKTRLKWDKEQLKNRYSVLRKQYVIVKSLLDQNDFSWDESQHTVVANDEAWDKYIKEHPDADTIRSNGCPIYNQLCTIFSESEANGNYAELGEGTPGDPAMSAQERSSSDSEDDPDFVDTPGKCQSTTPPSSRRRKRKRNGIDDVVVEAILEMAAVVKSRAAVYSQSSERFSLTNCVKALDELQSIEDQVYFAALDLFGNLNARETFISLKSDKRLTWLKGKFNASSSSLG